jgi:hypothetical protein
MAGALAIRVRTASVSRDFLDVFRVEPALGGRFHDDARAEPLAVLRSEG